MDLQQPFSLGPDWDDFFTINDDDLLPIPFPDDKTPSSSSSLPSLADTGASGSSDSLFLPLESGELTRSASSFSESTGWTSSKGAIGSSTSPGKPGSTLIPLPKKVTEGGKKAEGRKKDGGKKAEGKEVGGGRTGGKKEKDEGKGSWTRVPIACTCCRRSKRPCSGPSVLGVCDRCFKRGWECGFVPIDPKTVEKRFKRAPYPPQRPVVPRPQTIPADTTVSSSTSFRPATDGPLLGPAQPQVVYSAGPIPRQAVVPAPVDAPTLSAILATIGETTESLMSSLGLQ